MNEIKMLAHLYFSFESNFNHWLNVFWDNEKHFCQIMLNFWPVVYFIKVQQMQI